MDWLWISSTSKVTLSAQYLPLSFSIGTDGLATEFFSALINILHCTHLAYWHKTQDTQKEILGWLFDGVMKCMMLPAIKVVKIRNLLLQITRAKVVRLGEFEKLHSKLLHATKRMGLLSPLIVTITTKGNSRFYEDKTIRLSLNIDTKQALRDWATLLKMANKQPTPCADVMSAPVDYGGYCNAARSRAGGVWFGLEKGLPQIVWRVAFPPAIQNQLGHATTQKEPSLIQT